MLIKKLCAYTHRDSVTSAIDSRNEITYTERINGTHIEQERMGSWQNAQLALKLTE